jgi:hypothetical protein
MKHSEKINDYLISFVDKHFKKKRKDLWSLFLVVCIIIEVSLN